MRGCFAVFTHIAEFVLKLPGSYGKMILQQFGRFRLIEEGDMNNCEYFNPVHIIFGAGESKGVGS
jgi:hypothetical protein